MNKNAAIIEGDTTKKFNPVSKVKVSNSDTGESTWIPEDSKETHSLSVIKNGIYYAASEGYTAYDTVTVNVSSETEVNYEGIIADMPDLADLGLYDLDDLEGLDGLDLDLDELQDLENLILDGDLEEGEIPTSGSTIKGIDPDTGETLEVGLDEDGNLLEQALPDHIHIVVWPRKRHYLEGEIIDFSGIHVYLMKHGTERFTCEQYPTGEIPFGELMFPVTVAEGSTEGDGAEYSDGKGLNCKLYVFSTATYSFWDMGNFYYSPTATGVWSNAQGAWREGPVYGSLKEAQGSAFLTRYNGYVYAYAIDFTGAAFAIIEPANIHGYLGTLYLNTWKILSSDSDVFQNVPVSTVDPMSADIDDLHGGSQDIPVQWMRSDGEILEDVFQITIGEGEDEEQVDPYAGQCDFIWEGKKYCFNKSLARSEVMYSNGTVWQTWLGGQSPPYTVDQALKLKLIVQV